MKFIYSFFVFLFTALLSAQEKKSVEALNIKTPLVIDGVADEPVYLLSQPAKDFLQIQPYNGRPSLQKSEVHIFYDQTAIYIGAILFDTAPDSIFNFLSGRDNIGMSDYFGIYFDPYNQGQLAYGFFVTPAGVQTDLKAVKGDWESEDVNWNAVWNSKTRITEEGWFVEMRIPYSALRFPGNGGGVWGMNIFRNIRRYNSNNSWNFIDNKISGFIHQEGQLSGIKDLKPPVRLSLSPFSALYTQSKSDHSSSEFTYKGGMDLKYGISESFTLDMMLIPDFGQIQSDDKQLNLSPYELYYSEKRQFFTEGTELFNRANIFYSRRIGSSPKFSGRINEERSGNEIVDYSPSETQIVNTSKLSGRTRDGWGLGFLNSISLPAYGILSDTISGSKRKVLTQPLTNYNVSVIDRTLKNNSYISLINTNIMMANDPFMANVTGTDFQLRNKAKSIAVKGKGGISIRNEDKQETGFFSTLGIEKNNGKFHFGISQLVYSDKFNPNDLGYLQRNNEFKTNSYIYYTNRDPFWIFKETHNYLTWDHNRMYRNLSFSGNSLFLNSYSGFKNNYYILINMWLTGNKYDFYEPRVADRFYLEPRNFRYEFTLFTDSRKPLSLQIVFSEMNTARTDRHSTGAALWAGLRVGKRFQLSYYTAMNIEKNNRGFAGFYGTTDTIMFARRDINRIENTLSAAFTFNNRAGINFRVRHYWSGASYKEYFRLNSDGNLDNDPAYSDNHDENYNFFNCDLLFRWVFAPGSELTLAWKNSIFDNQKIFIRSYKENLGNILDSDQTNSFSLKVLYFIDYNNLRKN
jgi:hypothetical protein